MKMSDTAETQIAPVVTEIVPNINPTDHVVEMEVWQALEAEIKHVSNRIELGEDLQPEDVKNVQSLRKQVDDYVTSFNRSMRATQAEYKEAIAEKLDGLGYTVIENYVTEQRTKQKDIQNKRSTDKLNKLTEIINELVGETDVIKDTALASELLPAFYDRFPIIKSGAQSKNIQDWEPYKQVIKANLTMVDTFLQDEKYLIARRLPINSKTMQQLLQYIRSGDIERLATMEDIFKSDRAILEDMLLRNNIKTHQDAIAMIKELTQRDECDTTETLVNISKVVAIALTI